jgi:hypothetical protein
MLTELSRREKAANIKPDHDIDVYMKVRLLDDKGVTCLIELQTLAFSAGTF